MNMYTLRYKISFDAAHHLLNYNGKCANQHGHEWRVLFFIQTKNPLINHMVVDFTVLKGIVDELDHKDLNQVLDFNPTAENLSKYFYDKVKHLFLSIDENIVIKITVWESPKSSITYES